MAENDEASGGDSTDSPYLPIGPRRSTYTPPSGEYPSLFGQQASPEPEPEPELVAVVSEPSGLPTPPKRRSLQDDELVRTLSIDIQKPEGTLDAIEQLQAELQLREQEAQEFSAWEQRMRSIGTPEALESIAEAVPEFTGVIPIIPQQQQPAAVAPPVLGDVESESVAVPDSRSPGDAPADTTIASASVQIPQAAPATAPESPADAPLVASAEPFLHPEQFPPPRAEERVDVPLVHEPNLSDHIVFLPPWMVTPESEASAEQAGPGETGSIEDAAADSRPSDTGAPVPTPTDPEFEAEPEARPEAEPEAPPEPVVYELVEPKLPGVVQELSGVAPALPWAPEGDGLRGDFLAPETSSAELPGTEPASAEPASAEPASTERSGITVEHETPTPSPFEALIAGDREPEQQDEGPRTFSLSKPPDEAQSTSTSSQPIIPLIVDEEPEGIVDATDQAFTGSAVVVSPEGIATLPPATGSAPVPPVSGSRVPVGGHVFADDARQRPRIFHVELSAEEATPAELRVGRAARMFWLWFATNSSFVSIAFGAALFGLGMSLRQAILAVFIGVAISFLPLGLGTLAGKWSGQPTIVVSRATFGLVGNVVPAVLALLTRLFWGAALLWLVAVSTARILVGASLGGPFDETQLSYLVAAAAFALAFAVALFGYQLFVRLQLILSVVSGVLIVGLFVITWPEVNMRAALTVADGPWILVVTGVVLVFSFIGLVWANSSGDLARYQRRASSGAVVSLWASFGATLPAFLLFAYGALLAASHPGIAQGLLTAPLDTIARMIPGWYPVPLIAATALSLLSGLALSLYSGGFALRAVGMSLSRTWSVVVVSVVVLAITAMMILSGAGVSDVFRDLATSLAVPVAAWAGIFAAEVMIRRRGFHEESLLRPGGIYPAVNWINLSMLVVASVIGFGFTTASVSWLSWQGYGFALFGFPLHGEIAASDLGVLLALVLGLLTPLAAGVSTVRRQESARG